MERKAIVQLHHKFNEKDYVVDVPSNASMGEVYDALLHFADEMVKLMQEAIQKQQESRKQEEKKEDGGQPELS